MSVEIGYSIYLKYSHPRRSVLSPTHPDLRTLLMEHYDGKCDESTLIIEWNKTRKYRLRERPARRHRSERIDYATGGIADICFHKDVDSLLNYTIPQHWRNQQFSSTYQLNRAKAFSLKTLCKWKIITGGIQYRTVAPPGLRKFLDEPMTLHLCKENPFFV